MPETSTAMGFGFRCGFLGLLHMDIVQERLEREYDLDLIITAPSVVYKIILNGEEREEQLIDTPAKLPDPMTFQEILEPYVRLEMMTPTEYTGALMDLGQTRRGIYIEQKYLTPERSTLIYEVHPQHFTFFVSPPSLLRNRLTAHPPHLIRCLWPR